jgi:hypothetical protein
VVGPEPIERPTLPRREQRTGQLERFAAVLLPSDERLQRRHRDSIDGHSTGAAALGFCELELTSYRQVG